MDKKSEQILRKLKFIAETKKNNFPNTESFARKLTQYEGEDGQPFGCSARTIARDIKDLIEIHNAPLEYDALHRGYYLRDSSWEFNCPVFDENFTSMALLGTCLSADLLPEPLRSSVDNAVAQTLASNSSAFFDSAMVESLLCASGIKTGVKTEVFETVFDCWRLRQLLILTYKSPKGDVAEHTLEPHIVAFHHGSWYVKGYTPRTREIRVYAIQRVEEARFGGDTFETDRKLVDETRKQGLFNFAKVEGVQLLCDRTIAFYIYEQQKKRQSKIECQDDGSLLLTLQPTAEHDVLKWVLSEGGKIRVVAPEWLRQKVVEAGQKIIENNR